MPQNKQIHLDNRPQVEASASNFKLVAADGTECIVPDVDFANDKIWTITEALLSSCAR